MDDTDFLDMAAVFAMQALLAQTTTANLKADRRSGIDTTKATAKAAFMFAKAMLEERTALANAERPA